MNIQIASQLLDELEKQGVLRYAVDYRKAIKLGIEALKRVYLRREKPKRKYPELLSGETKD